MPNADKSFKLYDGYEHGECGAVAVAKERERKTLTRIPVMCKVGIDAADDEKRQRVLKDWRSWLIAHCDGDDTSKQEK